MIHPDNAVFFDKGVARKTGIIKARVERGRQIFPVNQVVTDGMTPPNVFNRLFEVELIEKVPVSFPETESVRVADSSLRREKMVG
jgi:hypothetical protein